MSSTRNMYDLNNYKRDLQASVGQGNYTLEPNKQCDGCFSTNIRNSNLGNSVCSNLIDVDSEIMGLNIKNTKCSEKSYLPSNDSFCNFKDEKDCPVFTGENTRLSNPPCTLRGTGWNRWEWLCQNPQDKAIMPNEEFFLIDTKLMTKDNHRPCVPNLVEREISCPEQTMYNDPEVILYNDREITHDVQTNDYEVFPSQTWRNVSEINKY